MSSDGNSGIKPWVWVVLGTFVVFGVGNYCSEQEDAERQRESAARQSSYERTQERAEGVLRANKEFVCAEARYYGVNTGWERNKERFTSRQAWVKFYEDEC